MSDAIRRPERGLEVLWQRHLPQGDYSASDFTSDSEPRTDISVHVAAFIHSEEAQRALQRGDLVVTVSVRS